MHFFVRLEAQILVSTHSRVQPTCWFRGRSVLPLRAHPAAPSCSAEVGGEGPEGRGHGPRPQESSPFIPRCGHTSTLNKTGGRQGSAKG